MIINDVYISNKFGFLGVHIKTKFYSIHCHHLVDIHKIMVEFIILEKMINKD